MSDAANTPRQPSPDFFMQSDVIPFGIFREKLNEVQENVFTLTTERFSRHLVNLGRGDSLPADVTIPDIKRRLVAAGFLTDPAGNLVIDVPPKEVMPKSTKPALVREWCSQLCAIQVRFRIASWNGMEKVEALQSLFIGTLTAADLDVRDNGHVFLSLSNWAIPYFIYCGARDVWFGKVQKDVALGLKGQSTKRIYKMVCSMYGKRGGAYELPVEEFRRMLNLSGEIRRKNVAGADGDDYYVTGKKTYRRADTLRRVLDNAKAAIDASGSDYVFDYGLAARNQNGRRGRQRMDTVVFRVRKRNPDVHDPHSSPADMKLFEDLTDLYRLYANNDLMPWMSVMEYAEKTVTAGAGAQVLAKHAYYRSSLPDGGAADADAALQYRKRLRHEFNIISKILKEDYGLVLPTKR